MIQGPQNKSIYTYQLELLAYCIERLPNEIQYAIANDQQGVPALMLKIAGLSINLTALLGKANLSHLNLKTGPMQTATSSKWDYFKSTGTFTKMERAAFSEYMGDYSRMHSILYANWKYWPFSKNRFGKIALNCEQLIKRKDQIHSEISQVLLSTLNFASGLNRVKPKLKKEFVGRKTYRGEKFIDDQELKRRIEAIKNNGEVIVDNPGFMRTSLSKDIAEGYAGKCLYIFKPPLGTDLNGAPTLITPNFPAGSGVDFQFHTSHLKQFLHLPGKFILHGYQCECDSPDLDNFLNYFRSTPKFSQKHIFYIWPVAPLSDETLQPGDLAQFKLLVEWARDKRISLDFLEGGVSALLKQKYPGIDLTSKMPPLQPVLGPVQSFNISLSLVLILTSFALLICGTPLMEALLEFFTLCTGIAVPQIWWVPYVGALCTAGVIMPAICAALYCLDKLWDYLTAFPENTAAENPAGVAVNEAANNAPNAVVQDLSAHDHTKPILTQFQQVTAAPEPTLQVNKTDPVLPTISLDRP